MLFCKQKKKEEKKSYKMDKHKTNIYNNAHTVSMGHGHFFGLQLYLTML